VCHSARLVVAPRLDASARARDFLLRRWTEWKLPGVGDEVALVVSELVTNAYLHVHSSVEVSLQVLAGALEVGVSDTGPVPPLIRPARRDLPADLDAVDITADLTDLRNPALHVGASGAVTAGRGLHIVAALCPQWGVRARKLGKTVWCRRELEESWSPSSPCACEPTDDGRLLAACV
jgi:hypothetical protein